MISFYIETINKGGEKEFVMKCFECGNNGIMHNHHVIPKVKGGTAVIPLCETCHGKVHGANLSTSELTRIALLKKDKEMLCRVFVLITVDKYYIDDITEYLEEFDFRRPYTKQNVRHLINKLKRFDIQTLLDVFSDILEIKGNVFYGNDFFIEEWGYFLEQTSLNFRKRTHYIR
jgi:hypothetical protein